MKRKKPQYTEDFVNSPKKRCKKGAVFDKKSIIFIQQIGSENSSLEKVDKRKKKSKNDINQNGSVTNLTTNADSLKGSLVLKQLKKLETVHDKETDLQPLKKKGNTKTLNKNDQKEVIDRRSESLETVALKGKTSKNKKTEDQNKKNLENKPGVLKTVKKRNKAISINTKQEEHLLQSEISTKKTKKKVRIDETEGLKVKKELADLEPHFSAKELPAKIIKSKLNKALTEEVKVSPLTVQKEKKGQKKLKIETEDPVDVKLDEDQELQDLQNGIATGLENESSNTEDSDLEVYYINKSAEKEAKKKEKELIPKKHSIFMPKEDQNILVQRIQDCIPENDSKNYKYRLSQLEWDKVPFKNYTLEDCQKVWTQLLKKVRHYRLLIEITQDVRQVIEQNDLKAQTKSPKNVSKRHPDMPKRPLSSYFLYYIRKKDKIAKEHPEADVTELNKYISEKYHSLPTEKKQKYDEIAAKNREKYKKDMEEFYMKHPELRKDIKKEPKVKKEKPPKKPETPYRFFVLSELSREQIDDQDKAEFKEVCREKWRQMPDIKKLGWINLAEEHLQKYQDELKEYMAKHPEYTPKPPSKPFLSREEISLKDKLAGKPKKPPGTAYSLFLSVVMQSEEIANIPVKERMNYSSVKWKNMSEEEKEYYRQLLTQINEQYEKDFKTYLDSLPEDKRQAEILLNSPKKKKADLEKPSTRVKSPKIVTTKVQSTKKKTLPVKKQKELVNPVPPPRSVYKYFAEKYEGENPKDAWKNLDQVEKERYEKELSFLKDRYIKEFEAFLKSLTKEELATFCANRTQQENYSSEESDTDSEVSSNESSENISDNESDDN